MSRRERVAEVQRSLATRRPRPPAPGDVRLSLIIPAYREADRIGSTIKRVRTELEPLVGDGELEIVVVDDGSGDGTDLAARGAEADTVVVQPVNRGKGAAVRAGVQAASGRTVAFTDADLAYAPAQVHDLLLAVEDGWDVVVGSRAHPGTTTSAPASRLRSVGSRVINLATRSVLLGDHADTQCGLKAFRSDVARILFGRGLIDGFAFDIELFAMVERFDLSLTELPVTLHNMEESTVRVGRDTVDLLADLGRIRWYARRGRYRLRPGEDDALLPGDPPSGH